MAKRRGNDEGTVYQDKNGVWWAQLSPDERGKRPKRRAKTQKEAVEKLRLMQRERSQGKNLSAHQPTVAQFLHTWLDTVITPTAKAKTRENYQAIVRLYIITEIGEVRLDKLTPPQWAQAQNRLLERVSSRTVRYARSLLCEALDVAMDWGYITRNVARLVDPPRLERRAMTILTPEQAVLFLHSLEGHRLAALYHMALALGLRRGELLGLRWTDIHWDENTITIAQTVVSRDVGGPEISTPKTKGSAATLPMLPALAAVLRTHWQNQQEERRLLDVRWQEHGLVFPSEVGTPISPRNLFRHFKETLAKAGLPNIRFHDLRHTCASLLIKQKVHPKVISAILRHSSIQITMDLYGHTFDESVREGLEGIDDLLKQQEG